MRADGGGERVASRIEAGGEQPRALRTEQIRKRPEHVIPSGSIKGSSVCERCNPRSFQNHKFLLPENGYPISARGVSADHVLFAAQSLWAGGNPCDNFGLLAWCCLLLPRIDKRHARLGISASVPRHDAQSVMEGCRCNDQVGLGEGMAALAPLLDQQPPLEHDVFADRKSAVLEHRAQLQIQPVIEGCAFVNVLDQFDPEADFREGDSTDKQAVERLSADEGNDFWLWPCPPQFGQDIGIEKPTFHS